MLHARARTRALSGRAATAAERLVRKERPASAWASSGAANARCSSTSSARAADRPAGALLGRGDAGAALRLIISNAGGILQGDRYVIEIDSPGGAGACDDAVGDANPRDGRQLRGPGPDLPLGGRLSGILPHPVIPHRHTRFVTAPGQHRPDRDPALFRSLMAGANIMPREKPSTTTCSPPGSVPPARMKALSSLNVSS